MANNYPAVIETKDGDIIKLLNDGPPSVVPVDRLVLHEANPRQGDVGALAVSYKENGFYGSVIVDARDMRVLAGNHRVKAAVALGMEKIPVQLIKTDSEMHAIKILLADNRHSDLATYDNEVLAELLQTVALSDEGLLGTGFDGDDVDELLKEVGFASDPEEAPEAEIDRAEELRVKWGVEHGQLWQIGRHRLLCGDSTNNDDVERLLGGNEPALMVTDPPYGVEYDPKWRAAVGINKNKNKMGKVQNDDRADWTEAWELSPANVAYCWHADRHASEVQTSLESAGFEMRSQIIWAKDRMALSRGHYHWQHEPCWYAFKPGKSADYIGDRKQTTLWNIPARDDSGLGHGTQKPLECMERPIRHHKGDVYEPFAGSGTTIVAAERQNRTCYAIEIDPGYVAVILERLSLMGLEPELQTELAAAA